MNDPSGKAPGLAVSCLPDDKVLVVDDDRHILIAVRTVLGDAGITVVTADSGQECLRLLEKGFSGIILLDIMMPGMDGWDTIQAIRDHGWADQVLIVMLTAKNTPDQKMVGLQEYVFDYITKPFEPEELTKKVQYYQEYLVP